jgi:hypothetical protein
LSENVLSESDMYVPMYITLISEKYDQCLVSLRELCSYVQPIETR